MTIALAPSHSAFAALLVVASALASPAQPAVTDLDGRAVAPLAAGGRATVLVFTAVDCPISDRYAPAVRRLAARYASEGVRVWLVYANRGETAAGARAHSAAFDYALPVALDPTAVLADRAGARVTPEAAVFDAAGRLVYRGRIDDRYVDFGVDRPVPTTHDLADAVASVLAGRAVAVPETRAIGCAIVRHQP